VGETTNAKPALLVPDWLPAEAWAAFVAHRKALRKPLTAQAAKLAIAKVDELRRQGHEPQAVLEQSILAGWQGLFPLRPEAKKPDGGLDAIFDAHW
jgi:hypothetical protein